MEISYKRVGGILANWGRKTGLERRFQYGPLEKRRGVGFAEKRKKPAGAGLRTNEYRPFEFQP